ncbi:hypothetical protein A3K86_16035 [Photobacterium jeanii]|uniref:N-acetyltransferase domain-containing protein n=1 Tax=Photobacterium jeanii TaxID=858640 RepID=A0A178K750_9GAMM|nr:GNAT family N-acetyltransferase [Photobacterium jeanii]OAN13168.1 hypothetical protein A3K86_16035 [Photobacterium jeanii]PST89320.1 N-acetyltransferase [Photobacterium jeanii]
MNSLFFKRYEPSYFDSCVSLVKATWNLHAGFEAITDDELVYAYYLKMCLNWNDHLDIIVDRQENVKGVLFASKEKTSFIKELFHIREDRKINKWKNQKLKQGAFGELKQAQREFARFVQNDKLGEQDAELFDSEINLFIVSPELKGKGLGRMLMDRYMVYCKNNDIESTFLWTDIECDYFFYQKYGFKIHKKFTSEKITVDHVDKADDGMIFYLEIPT